MSDIVTLNGYKIKDEKAVRSYESIAQMKADTKLKEGYHVKTKGYYEANDGGHGEYVIVDDDTLVDDGGSIHVLTNGLRAKLIIDDSIVPEVFGAYADGEHHDSEVLQNVIDYCISNQIKLESPSNKTYLINDSLLFTDKIDMDFNNSTIKTNSAIDMLVFNYPSGNEYQGFLKNIVIDMNSIATIGIHGIRIIKKLISGITIKNITGIGYQIDLGYEVIFENSHLYGSSNTSVGLALYKGDCHYKDLIMIDVHTGIIASSTNFYSRIHAWIKTRELIPNSIFMKCVSTSHSFLNQCYSDTYHYSFYVNNDHRIKLTEHYNYINQGIMNAEILEQLGNMIYMFYFTNPEWSQRVSITNSHIQGLPGNIDKASFTNLQQNEILMYCDEQTRIVNFTQNFKANEIPVTELLTNDFSLSSSYQNQISRISGVVDINIRLQNNSFISGANQKITVYTLPENFRPITEIPFMLPVTDNTYNLKNYLFGYITKSGEIIINIPTGTDLNTNDRLLINKSFITVSSQP